jgi:hypothetical protein
MLLWTRIASGAPWPNPQTFEKRFSGFKGSELMADFLTAMIERTLDTCCAPRTDLLTN